MLEDRYAGCLLGLGAGDALGAPLEFMSPSQIRIKHGTVREMIGGGWLHLRPGETTDDTAMALCLAESLAEKGAFDREDAASRYVAWLKSGPRDAGNTTRASLTRIAEGMDIDQASAAVHSEVEGKTAGNGALMRCAPLALAFPSEPETLIAHTKSDAGITHHDPLAGLGAAALNLLVAGALGPAKDKASLLEQTHEILAARDESHALPDPAGKKAADLRPTGYVLDTLECALWAFLNAKGFEACLVLAVNLGGDADTTGAVCGALAGAWYGASKIPARWLSALDRRPSLARVAKRLAARFGGADPARGD